MELVERLRETAADFHQAHFDAAAKQLREAADLLEEALKAVKEAYRALDEAADELFNEGLPEAASKCEHKAQDLRATLLAILTKSQGEKIE